MPQRPPDIAAHILRAHRPERVRVRPKPIGLGALYVILQRTVAERDSIRPTMSLGRHTLLRYLPIVFAVVQLFILAALVVYYIAQTVLRIVQQRYITRSLFSKV